MQTIVKYMPLLVCHKRYCSFNTAPVSYICYTSTSTFYCKGSHVLLCLKLTYLKGTKILQLKAFYKRVHFLKYTENKAILFDDSSTSGCRSSLANYVQNSLTLKAE